MDAAAIHEPDTLRPDAAKRRPALSFHPAAPGLAAPSLAAPSLAARVLGATPMDSRPPGGRFRAVRRLTSVMLWTLVAIPIQTVLIALPGPASGRFSRFYHRTLCRLIGLKVVLVGETCRDAPVLFLSNHSSWLDILVLGGVLDAAFVAKSEVGTWPLIRTIARLGRTVFVSRSRNSTGKEAEAMRARLNAGDSLILFPEGTSDDGGRVLPFRSSFLAIADAARRVQPVSVVYDRLAGMPIRRYHRPVFAWYGDMDIGSHFWRLARHGNTRVTVLLHEPGDPASFSNRKLLNEAVYRVVAAGAATLRQNRPPEPLPLLPPLRPARPAAPVSAAPALAASVPPVQAAAADVPTLPATPGSPA